MPPIGPKSTVCEVWGTGGHGSRGTAAHFGCRSRRHGRCLGSHLRRFATAGCAPPGIEAGNPYGDRVAPSLTHHIGDALHPHLGTGTGADGLERITTV